MRPPQGFEWLLILFVVLLLFGSKRLPDMARGIGRSLRILKAETRGLAEDEAETQPQPSAGAPAVTSQASQNPDAASPAAAAQAPTPSSHPAS